MKNKNYYIMDYYLLKKSNEEKNFIDLLNKNNQLKELIIPSLDVIKNKLFFFKKENNLFEVYKIIPENELEINQVLYKELKNNVLFKVIIEDNISSSLITEVFEMLCKRIFEQNGYNNERSVLQKYILLWLESNLAKQIAKDDRFSSLEVLFNLIEQTELCHQFNHDLIINIPKKWIDDNIDEWVSVEKKPQEIIEQIISFSDDNFKEYELLLTRLEDSTPWEYISESTRISNYVSFNNNFYFKSFVLFEKDIDAWVHFWDNLKYPALQDILFNYIRYPDDIIKIATILVNSKSEFQTKLSYLACILLKNAFESSKLITKNLSIYEDQFNEVFKFEKDKTLIIKGDKIYKEWIKTKQTFYQKLITLLSNILNNAELEEWVFSHKPHSMHQNQYVQLHNDEVQIIIEAYSTYLSATSEKIINIHNNFNLQKFNFSLSRIEQSLYKEQIEVLWEKLIEFIESDIFYWDKSNNEPHWSTLKGIGVLLNLSKSPELRALEFIDRFIITYEGWNVNYDEMYKKIDREVFAFSGAIMLLEHDDILKEESKESFFKQLIGRLFTQRRFSIFDQEETYQKPLHLIWEIVNQKYSQLKLFFEEQLILNLDNLISVLDIFYLNNYQISSSSKGLLKDRVSREYHFVRKQYSQNQNIQNILDYIEQEDSELFSKVEDF